MSNRDCNGDFFVADGVRYYRCLWDGTTMPSPANGSQCPNCKRTIDGTEIGDLAVRTLIVAIYQDGTEIRLPDTHNA